MRLLLFYTFSLTFIVVGKVTNTYAETGVCYDSNTQIVTALAQQNITRLEELLLAFPDDTLIYHKQEIKQLPVFLVDICLELEKKLTQRSESFIFKSFMSTVFALSIAIGATMCAVENFSIRPVTLVGMYTFSISTLAFIAKQVYNFHGEEPYTERVERFVNLLLGYYGHLFSNEDQHLRSHIEGLLVNNTRYKVPGFFKGFLGKQ